MFFGGYNPKITVQEFRRGISSLSKLSRNEKQTILLVFIGDLDEDGSDGGITKDEFERRINWLKNNKNAHNLSEEKIKYAKEKLADFF